MPLTVIDLKEGARRENLEQFFVNLFFNNVAADGITADGITEKYHWKYPRFSGFILS